MNLKGIMYFKRSIIIWIQNVKILFSIFYSAHLWAIIVISSSLKEDNITNNFFQINTLKIKKSQSYDGLILKDNNHEIHRCKHL